MINIKDEADVQIWCDYQEEVRQTSADFFLRLRFSNFRIFLIVDNDYVGFLDCGDGINGNGHGNGWGDGDGNGFGDGLGDGYGYGYGNGYGNGLGDGYGNGTGNDDNGNSDSTS